MKALDFTKKKSKYKRHHVGRRVHGIGTDHEQQRQHIPTPGNILQKTYQRELGDHAE